MELRVKISATPLRWLLSLAAILMVLAITITPPSGKAETPSEPRSSLYGIFVVPADRRAFAALDQLGVGWVRQQWQMGDDRSERKLRVLVKTLPKLVKRGIGLWLSVYHRDRNNLNDRGTIGFANARRGGFPPMDPSLYQDRLGEAVRRLVDAIRSAGASPGRWLVIQINNEVVPRDVAGKDRASRFWHGTFGQYLDMLATAYDAVKRIDPDVPLAAGGISSTAMEPVLQGEHRIARWYDRLLGEGRFDWADIHLRHRIGDIPAKVAWVRTRWGGPLAATEVAGPDARVAKYSESGQAEDIVARMNTARNNGVDRLFWAGLAENPHVAPLYQKEGLIERGSWRRKAAFDAYARLIRQR